MMIVRKNHQQGISLFVTISALLILSVLTISITAQLMAPTFAATSASRQIIDQNKLRSALAVLQPLVRLAAVASATDRPNLLKLDSTPFEIDISGQSASFILQDVNGLIDINAASQNLIAAVLVGIGQEDRLTTILQARNAAPFSSVEAFTDLLNLQHNTGLNRLITVNSGRRRINSQTAPIALLEILAERKGSRQNLIASIDPRFFHTRPVTAVLVFQGRTQLHTLPI